jgi:hypothetical protein
LSTSLHSIGFPSTLQILDQIDHDTRRVTLRAQTTVATASCPACGTPSRRVHGAYWRSLGDVACFGHPTLLLVWIRRFRCAVPACPRRTFAEPLPGVAQTRARQTDQPHDAAHACAYRRRRARSRGERAGRGRLGLAQGGSVETLGVPAGTSTSAQGWTWASKG